MGTIRCTLRKTGLIALFFSYSTLSFGQQPSSSGTGQRLLAPIKTPASLRADIQVEKVMDIGQLGVRLLKNEKTGEFLNGKEYYNEVFIKN